MTGDAVAVLNMLRKDACTVPREQGCMAMAQSWPNKVTVTLKAGGRSQEIQGRLLLSLVVAGWQE
ncbi:hypothetical protein PG997_008250 [Apiospora hydei]|uniref:DUF397 domain-containing protein n=1 Tax=Apiospora hydei TaxID=1337664 RepID=A0ABR1WAC5_9PEZI